MGTGAIELESGVSLRSILVSRVSAIFFVYVDVAECFIFGNMGGDF